MVKAIINPGTAQNSGDGDPLRTAGVAVKNNFDELYARGGDQNARTGVYGTILGGTNNTVTGDRSSVGGGQGNIVGGARSMIPGGQEGSTARYGQVAFSAGKFSVAGDAQGGFTVLRRQITTNNPTWLTSDGLAEAATNLFNMTDHSALTGRYTVIAKQVGSNAMAVWRLDVALVRNSGVDSIVIMSGRAQGAAPDAYIGAGGNWRLDTWNNTVLGSMGNWFTGSGGATINVVGKLNVVETLTQPMTIPGDTGGGTGDGSGGTINGVSLGISYPTQFLVGQNMNLDLDEIAAIGCRHLRVDIRWNETEYNRGSYDWSSKDPVVNAIVARGMGVVGIAHDLPGWARSLGGFNSDQVRQAYAEFCGAAAGRYGNKVFAWELGNEVNDSGNYGGAPNMGNYCDLLRRTYPLIKAAYPAAIVITGGPSGAQYSTPGDQIGAPDWYNGLYDYGGKGYFDQVGTHPYSYPNFPNYTGGWNAWRWMTETLRPRMVAEGDGNKKVWCSEYGDPTSGANASSEADQAAHLQQAWDLSVSYGWISGLSYYTWRDYGGDAGYNENWFGMIRPDRSRKAIYYTFDNITP